MCCGRGIRGGSLDRAIVSVEDMSVLDVIIFKEDMKILEQDATNK